MLCSNRASLIYVELENLPLENKATKVADECLFNAANELSRHVAIVLGIRDYCTCLECNEA